MNQKSLLELEPATNNGAREASRPVIREVNSLARLSATAYSQQQMSQLIPEEEEEGESQEPPQGSSSTAHPLGDGDLNSTELN
ncbi:unnamed protein product [Rodentolepis nana]|uniref:Uncharacterized protein n=1 Tax=Rodentolepis nana TaxID=102285 RepID=A0A0R3TLD4_RODNA|nr:unnamed protein product [Rodentolepis nana]